MRFSRVVILGGIAPAAPIEIDPIPMVRFGDLLLFIGAWRGLGIFFRLVFRASCLWLFEVVPMRFVFAVSSAGCVNWKQLLKAKHGRAKFQPVLPAVRKRDKR